MTRSGDALSAFSANPRVDQVRRPWPAYRDLFHHQGISMNLRFRLSFSAFALLPAVVGAVPCQFGCRTPNGCDGSPPSTATASVIPYSLHNLAASLQRLDLPARSRPPLLGESAQSPIVVYGTCDDLNVAAGPGDYAGYLERDTGGISLLRHRLDVDARGYVGNADPVSGARGWWPGIVSWPIPMATGQTAELRIDYSSYRSGYSWSHYGNQLRVMLDGVQQDFVLTASDQFAIELNWTPEGDVALLVADLDAAGQRFATATTVTIPIVGTATESFRPLATLVGRRGSYEFRWSRGELMISSELSYSD
jgi:hypothetical protein